MFGCNPPLDQKLVCFTNPKTIILNKKYNLKSGRKEKIRRRDLKDKARQTNERIDETKAF